MLVDWVIEMRICLSGGRPLYIWDKHDLFFFSQRFVNIGTVKTPALWYKAPSASIFLYVCMSVCVLAHLCEPVNVLMCACAWNGQKSYGGGAKFLVVVYLISTQGCSLNLGLMVRLDHLTSESQGCSCLHLLSDGFSNAWHYGAVFSMGVLWLTLFSACRACILPTEPSPTIK